MGDDHVEGMDLNGSEYKYTRMRMVGLRKEYSEINTRLAKCKARSGEEAKRSDALNALEKLTDIATKGVRNCDGMMGKAGN
ncbi:unnamed protein product [Laminaria digitata]